MDMKDNTQALHAGPLIGNPGEIVLDTRMDWEEVGNFLAHKSSMFLKSDLLFLDISTIST